MVADRFATYPSGRPGQKGTPSNPHRKMGEAFVSRLLPSLIEMSERGMTLQQIAAELAARHVKLPDGGTWTATAVRRVLARA